MALFGWWRDGRCTHTEGHFRTHQLQSAGPVCSAAAGREPAAALLPAQSTRWGPAGPGGPVLGRQGPALPTAGPGRAMVPSGTPSAGRKGVRLENSVGAGRERERETTHKEGFDRGS